MSEIESGTRCASGRMLARSSVPLMLLLAAVIAAACGSSNAPGARPDTDSDDDVARSMLLSLADFPPGWVHKPMHEADLRTAQAATPYSACFQAAFQGETGRALGGEFSDQETTMLSINPSVFVFDGSESARNGVDGIVTESRCVADAIGDGIDLDGTAAFGPTKMEALPDDVFGEAAYTYRITNVQVYKDRGDAHVLIFDTVLLLDGRVVYRIEGFRRHEPIDPQLLSDAVQQARGKILQAP